MLSPIFSHTCIVAAVLLAGCNAKGTSSTRAPTGDVNADTGEDTDNGGDTGKGDGDFAEGSGDAEPGGLADCAARTIANARSSLATDAELLLLGAFGDEGALDGSFAACTAFFHSPTASDAVWRFDDDAGDAGDEFADGETEMLYCDVTWGELFSTPVQDWHVDTLSAFPAAMGDAGAATGVSAYVMPGLIADQPDCFTQWDAPPPETGGNGGSAVIEWLVDDCRGGGLSYFYAADGASGDLLDTESAPCE